MKAEVYIKSGFLGAGKTTLIQKLYVCSVFPPGPYTPQARNRACGQLLGVTPPPPHP